MAIVARMVGDMSGGVPFRDTIPIRRGLVAGRVLALTGAPAAHAFFRNELVTDQPCTMTLLYKTVEEYI